MSAASGALRQEREAAIVRAFLEGEHRVASQAFISLEQGERGWREALDAAAGSPAGAIEVYSRDHARAAGQSDAGDWFASAREVAGELERRELTLRAIVPLGLVADFQASAWHAGTRAAGFFWERILSWAALDVRFRALLDFFEGEIAAQLPAASCGRFVATFVRAGDPRANSALAERDAAFARALGAGFSSASVVPFIGQERWSGWCARLAALLDHPPNVIAAFRLADVAGARGYPLDLAELLGSRAAEVSALAYRARVDEACMDYVGRLQRDPVMGPLLRPRPALDAAMEWDLVPRLIAKTLGIPTE